MSSTVSSVIPERERQLLLDLALDRITLDEFCRSYPVEFKEMGALGLSILRNALRAHDAEAVEFGMMIAGTYGASLEEDIPVLRALALEGHATDRLTAWARTSGSKSFIVLGVVDFDAQSHPTQPWFSTYRTLVAEGDGAPEPGGPLLALRADTDPDATAGWGISLCSSSTVWLDASPESIALRRADPDDCLLRFAAVWEVLNGHVTNPELLVEGCAFHEPIARLRAIGAGVG